MSRWITRATWIVPALLIAGAALLTRERLWLSQVVGMRGGLMRSVPAYVVLTSMPLLAGLYALSFTWLVTAFTAGGGGMRTPNEVEQGCAALLLRAMLVLAMYALAIYCWYV